MIWSSMQKSSAESQKVIKTNKWVYHDCKIQGKYVKLIVFLHTSNKHLGIKIKNTT